MNKSRLQIARQDILRHFDGLSNRVFSYKDIAHEMAAQREFWRLAQSTTVDRFIDFLKQSGRLREVVFSFPQPYKRAIRYTWGPVNLYEVALSLAPNCYFSHYTAVKFHGLTEQLPKTIYVNDEQPNPSVSTAELTQKTIDLAFRRPARITSRIAETKDFRVCLLSGKNTGKLGVITESVADESGQTIGPLRFTNVERTLIDITVRPAYAGGPFEVAKAFRLAMGKCSVNVLAATLQKLAYTYPYHQAIGFYLDRAGYKPSTLDLLRRFPMKFDFYLAHGMGPADYVKDWRLFIPKGF